MSPILSLYVKTGCPYCARVHAAMKALGISATEKNIADDTVAAALIARGGKRQVPYLVDETAGVEMYESEDIVEYLEKNYGNGTATAPAEKPNVCIPPELR